jgi:hypothetical protein
VHPGHKLTGPKEEEEERADTILSPTTSVGPVWTSPYRLEGSASLISGRGRGFSLSSTRIAARPI